MKQLTIRKVSSELDRAIGEESRLKGQSINQTVLDLLQQALGMDPKGRMDNGLARLAGTWTQQEFLEFQRHIGIFETAGRELWEP